MLLYIYTYIYIYIWFKFTWGFLKDKDLRGGIKVELALSLNFSLEDWTPAAIRKQLKKRRPFCTLIGKISWVCSSTMSDDVYTKNQMGDTCHAKWQDSKLWKTLEVVNTLGLLAWSTRDGLQTWSHAEAVYPWSSCLKERLFLPARFLNQLQHAHVF